MTGYALYLESGPQHKTTMVHVLDLLGCHVRRRTTDEALEAAPEAIRTWLRFFADRGEPYQPDAPFETHVEVHVTEGTWLGNGDPPSGFAPDFAPLRREELEDHLRRLGLVYAEVERIAGQMPGLDENGRPLDRILRHIGAAGAEYVRCSLDKPEPLKAALKALDREDEPLAAALRQTLDLSLERMAAATDEELNRQTNRGAKTWTVRRTLRRTLEHGWEHLREISERSEAGHG